MIIQRILRNALQATSLKESEMIFRLLLEKEMDINAEKNRVIRSRRRYSTVTA